MDFHGFPDVSQGILVDLTGFPDVSQGIWVNFSGFPGLFEGCPKYAEKPSFSMEKPWKTAAHPFSNGFAVLAQNP